MDQCTWLLWTVGCMICYSQLCWQTSCWKRVSTRMAIDSTSLYQGSRNTSDILQFMLVVDGFGVKYVVGEDNALHLEVVLWLDNTTSTKSEGRRYTWITWDWEYTQRKVYTSMSNYLCGINSEIIQSQKIKVNKRCTVFLNPDQVWWSEEAIHNTHLHNTTTGQER